MDPKAPGVVSSLFMFFFVSYAHSRHGLAINDAIWSCDTRHRPRAVPYYRFSVFKSHNLTN